MVFPAEAHGFIPDGAETKQTIPQSLTHEDLVNLVGPDYQQLVDSEALSLGIIEEGESLTLNFPPPHDGSDAEYAYEGIRGNAWVWIYLLRNKPAENGEIIKARTSEHRHLHADVGYFAEYYCILRGRMNIFLGKGVFRKGIVLDKKNNHLRVPPNTFHSAESSDTPAFVLAYAPNTAHISREQLHRHS